MPAEANDVASPLAEPPGLKPFVLVGLGMVFGAKFVEKLHGADIQLQHQRVLSARGCGSDPAQATQRPVIMTASASK